MEMVEDFPFTKFQKPPCSYSGVRCSFPKVLKKHFLSLEVWFSFSNVLKKNILSFLVLWKKNHTSREGKCSFQYFGKG
jgi:hypothetical protein